MPRLEALAVGPDSANRARVKEFVDVRGNDHGFDDQRDGGDAGEGPLEDSQARFSAISQENIRQPHHRRAREGDGIEASKDSCHGLRGVRRGDDLELDWGDDRAENDPPKKPKPHGVDAKYKNQAP